MALSSCPPPQVLLQLLIIITGNYNFFNLLTIVLCFSLLDDEHLGLGRSKRRPTSGESVWVRALLWSELTWAQAVPQGEVGPALGVGRSWV